MNEIGWLLLGAGDIAVRRVAPALVEVPGSRLIAVCDLDTERAATLAAKHDAQAAFTDVTEALACEGVDAVYVATPQHTHIDLSLRVLAAGKHLLCEKPLGLNGAECLRLLSASRASDRVASCSNYRRLSDQYRKTEGLLKQEAIGRLVGGWAVYSTPFYNPGRAPMRKALGLSRVKELGYYLIDIVHNLFGMPSEVMARACIMDPEAMNDIEDIATVVLTFPGGGIFTIVFNCRSPGTRHELEFFGTTGRIHWRDWPPHGNGPVIHVGRNGTEEIEARTHENWHLPMIEDYVDALRSGRQPVCTLESAVRTEIITDAIFRSIDSGRAEPVAPCP